MLKRRTVLLGLVGAGGLAILADRSILSDATAMTADLAGVVDQAKQASAIAKTLQNGDPVQIQDLLNRLVDEEGTDPSDTQPSLFGALASFGGAAAPEDSTPAPDSDLPAPAPQGDHVSMIITTRTGGLAIVNGRAMRQGETIDGLTLVAVTPDRVVLAGSGGDRVVCLPGPADLPAGPSVAAAGTSGP